MFIAFVTGPYIDESTAPTEMVLDLRASTMEDAKNELYSLFGLVPGQIGYYQPEELAKARICEISSEDSLSENDVEYRKEDVARLEAEAYAEAESKREMEQFERSKKKHRR